MDGVALEEFHDWVEGTGPAQIKGVGGKKGLINAASLHTYMYSKMLDGRFAEKKMIHGGRHFRKNIVFKGNGTFEWYQSGAHGSWKNPQRLFTMRSYWRKNRVHMAWADDEILLNETIANGSEAARFQQFVDIRDEKEMIMWIEKWQGLERSLAAVPNYAQHEGEGPGMVESTPLLAFVNEDDNGLWGSGWANAPTGTYHGGTVMGIDPTDPEVDGKWAPAQQTYSSATGGDPNNIIGAMDDIWLDLQYEAPSMHKQYFEDPRYRTQVIWTSKRGLTIYRGLLRNSNDRLLAGGQDPAYPNPMFHGIPIIRWSEFENGAYYEPTSGAVPVAEFAGLHKGPRFVFAQTRFTYPIFHPSRFFKKGKVTQHHNVPDVSVCPVTTYTQNICVDRRRNGIVSPSGAIYSA